MKTSFEFSTIAIAATFDHLHKGHEKFLNEAFKFGRKVVIGLTSDKMAGMKIRNPNAEIRNKFQIQNFQTRKENLEKYLKKNHLSSRAEIIEIQDIYGPAIDPKSHIEALLVTRDTLKGGRLVNKKRKELHLSPLKIITIPFQLAEDRKRISSTRIREGELNREGKIYKRLLTFNPPAGGPISQELRLKLKNPQGELIKGDSNDLTFAGLELEKRIGSISNSEKVGPFQFCVIISIGDEVTKLANQLKLPVSISIVDFKVNRKVKYSRIEEHGFRSDFIEKGNIVTVRNPPGYIRKSLVNAIYRSIKLFLEKGEKTIIRVHGEEDLAGLPALLLAPLGTVVLYGQPQEGVVLVEVTEKVKEKLVEMNG